MEKPILAITMGDPAFIGPEITVKALARPEIYQICRPLVVGDACMLERARYVTGLEDVRVHAVDTPSAAEYAPGMIDVLDMRLVDADSLPIGKVSAKAGGGSLPLCGEGHRSGHGRRGGRHRHQRLQ